MRTNTRPTPTKLDRRIPSSATVVPGVYRGWDLKNTMPSVRRHAKGTWRQPGQNPICHIRQARPRPNGRYWTFRGWSTASRRHA